MSTNLTANERSSIFQTKVLSRQIVRYIKSRPSVTRDDIEQVFSDIPLKKLSGTLRSMKHRGAIMIDERGFCTALLETYPGELADRLWKTARMMRRFTARSLAKTAEVPHRFASDCCLTWADHRFIVRIGSDHRDALYKMVSTELLRPTVARKTEVPDGR